MTKKSSFNNSKQKTQKIYEQVNSNKDDIESPKFVKIAPTFRSVDSVKKITRIPVISNYLVESDLIGG